MMNYTNLLADNEAYQEMAQWASLFWQADHPAELHGTGDPDFPFEWRVFGPGPRGRQIATISYDGVGASWSGPDDLWMRVVGSRSE